MQKSFSSHGFIFEFHSQRYFTLLIPLFFNIRLSIIKCSLLTPVFRLFFLLSLPKNYIFVSSPPAHYFFLCKCIWEMWFIGKIKLCSPESTRAPFRIKISFWRAIELINPHWHSDRPTESKVPQWMSYRNVALCISRLQLQPLAPESFLSYSHLSHSVSSHLDSSPESSEAGADIPLSINGTIFKWGHMNFGEF